MYFKKCWKILLSHQVLKQERIELTRQPFVPQKVQVAEILKWHFLDFCVLTVDAFSEKRNLLSKKLTFKRSNKTEHWFQYTINP